VSAREGSRAQALRAQMAVRWERAAAGWARRADAIRSFGMPVAAWMIDRLNLQAGQLVLELAAGPGDTGFLAAELVKPGGRLICSDLSPAMLDVARARSHEQGIENVEFRQLELEWIDLETASVDAILCRWGLMLAADPAAALTEMRRVLRVGGRLTLAVWDAPERNPWATIPSRALVELGHEEPGDPEEPGMFALAAPGRLETLLVGAGFTEVVVETLSLSREDGAVERFLEATLDLSQPFAETRARLGEREWAQVEARVAELAAPYAGPDGTLRFPASSLVAAASA
jgi:SAM-dependent methyltransferase